MLNLSAAVSKKVLGALLVPLLVATAVLTTGHAAANNPTPTGGSTYSSCNSLYAKTYDISTSKGAAAFKKYQNGGCGSYCSAKASTKTVNGKKHKIETVTCKKPTGSGSGSSDGITDPALTSGGCTGTNCSIISKYINPLIKLLSATVGIIAVIAIILGGIQVSMSAGDPQKAASGRSHVRNALIGLVMYILLLVFLNWIIPGGI